MSTKSPSPGQLSLWDVGAQVDIPATPTIAPPDYDLKTRKYLTGPIIYYPGGWDAGNLPPHIPQARIDLVQTGEDDQATLIEALAYLSTASLCMPLSSDWATIMFYLSDEVFTMHKLTLPDDPIWAKLGLPSKPTLNHYQADLLRKLRCDIRRSVVKHSDGKAAAVRDKFK
jgi:hypothetical protein